MKVDDAVNHVLKRCLGTSEGDDGSLKLALSEGSGSEKDGNESDDSRATKRKKTDVSDENSDEKEVFWSQSPKPGPSCRRDDDNDDKGRKRFKGFSRINPSPRDMMR